MTSNCYAVSILGIRLVQSLNIQILREKPPDCRAFVCAGSCMAIRRSLPQFTFAKQHLELRVGVGAGGRNGPQAILGVISALLRSSACITIGNISKQYES